MAFSTAARQAVSSNRFTLAIGVLVCLQVWLAYALPVFADETYYWSWSESLSWGYYDHPPMIAWLLSILPIRLVSLGCFYLGLWFVFLAARLYDPHSAIFAPLIIISSPIGLVGGVVATPDGPVFLFWSMFVYGFFARRDWLSAFSIGAAILSKMTIWLCIPGALLLLSGRQRIRVICVVVLMASGHALWSVNNDGLPWAFQGSRAIDGFNLPEFLAGQLGLMGPVLCLLAWRLLERGTVEQRRLFVYLSGPTLVACLVASCCLRVEANWPLLGWTVVAVLGAGLVDGRLAKGVLLYGGLTAALAVIAALNQTALPSEKGPDRLSVAYVDCLSKTRDPANFVALRYQDMSMVLYGGHSANYHRPPGRRRSQYDLESRGPAQLCGKMILGPPVLRSLVCSSESSISGCEPFMAMCDCSN